MDELELKNAGAGARAKRALVVDLDGTLVIGDTLWEGAAKLARADLLGFLAALFALFRGRAAFKKAVSDRVALSIRDVRLNEDILAFLRDQARSRPLVLATAADQRVADAIGGELGFFDKILGSRDGENLKGARKLGAIRAWLAGDAPAGFDYIGDSRADRPVWAEAENLYVVAPDDEAAKRIAGVADFAARFNRDGPRATQFLRAMRPYQWVKNVLIFTPLALSHQFADPDKLRVSVLTFIAFCLCASATYIWNDILDIGADRAHPRKRARPIAAGAISIPAGLGFSFVLLLAGFSIAFAFLPAVVSLAIAGYIAFTLAYSLYFKEKLLIDAMSLGLLYGYRILIGAAATGIAVSDWLIAFSTFFFFGLAMVKRYSEISKKAPDAAGKIAGRGYYAGDREIIGVLGVASSFISILVLALYITSPAVAELYAHPQALWFICLVMLYWLSRIWVLAHRMQMPDDPILFALRDRNSLLAAAICAAVGLAAL